MERRWPPWLGAAGAATKQRPPLLLNIAGGRRHLRGRGPRRHPPRRARHTGYGERIMAAARAATQWLQGLVGVHMPDLETLVE